jgi:hypothetical protein
MLVSEEKKEETEELLICPRCGGRVSYVSVEHRGERAYYYFVHYVRDGKRRRKRKCYIGPVDEYEKVEKFVKLGLTSILKLDFVRVVERAVENFTEAAKRASTRELPNYIEKTREMRKAFKRLTERLEELERELTSILQLSQSTT